jgi:hypothetical protein
MSKTPKKVPRNAIVEWMSNEAAHYLLDQLTSEARACDIIGLRTHMQLAAHNYWVPQMDTRKLKHNAQVLIQKRVQSDHFIRNVRRRLRDDDEIVTHLVNECYFEAEEHWDDDEYMHDHRKQFVPNSQHRGIAVVVVNFDKHAGSAALERLGKGGHGVNKHIKLSSVDADSREVLSDEALVEIGRSCGQSELLKAKLWDNDTFREAFLQVSNG